MKRLSLRALVFPPRCAACRERLHWYSALTDPTYALCSACEKDWESATLEVCGVCACTVTQCDCLTAELKRAHAAGHRKLVYYEHARPNAAQNRVIYTVKNQRSSRAHAWLASMLCRPLEELLPARLREKAVLTYMPRAPHAKHTCGTDQAEELAKALGRASGIPCLRLLRRTGKTKNMQKRLSPAARKKNAAESYAIKRGCGDSIRGRVIVLVDDIVTTGNSMAVGVRLLRAAGADRVFCLSVASDDYNSADVIAQRQKNR